MKKSFLAAAAGLIAFIPAIAMAAISSGTVLVGTMNTNLDSSSAVVGQPFTVSNVHTQDYSIHGATLYGHVAQVVKAGQGREAKILLAYDKLHTLSGNSYAVSGNTTQVQVITKSNALKEAGGAAAGAIVGSIVGRTFGHTNLGAPIGAGAGYVYAKNNRAEVTIAANSTLQMEVLRARPQAR
jgi:hypothetical protein